MATGNLCQLANKHNIKRSVE